MDATEDQEARDLALRETPRLTTLQAYHKLRDFGGLAAGRWHVFDLVWHRGPGTSAEILEEDIRTHPQRALTQSRARFTELRDMGLIAELGIVTCRVTGNRAILYDVTGRAEPLPLPRKRKRDSTKRQLLEEAHRIATEALLVLGKASADYSDLILRAEHSRLLGELRAWRNQADV